MAYRLYNWDWSGAEAAIKRAIQLKPSSAMAHNEYLRLLLSLGRFPEALTEAQKTLALDPHAAVYWLNEGIVLYTLRRLDEAEARFQRALELEPSFSSANRRLVRLYLAQGRIPEARAALERLEAQPTRVSARALQAQVEAEAGNAAAARRMLAALDGNVRMRQASTVAAAYLALGDRAAALAALRQGITERAIQPLSLAAPELDELRTDADFAQLLTEMHLPTGSIGALVAVVQQNAANGTTPLPALASAEAAQ
jgi:tetratricopeptide (TPR) repeat protein